MNSDLVPETIEKEEIVNLSFKHVDLVNNPLEILRQLQSALLLGNSYKHKIKLIFDSDSGLKEVHTTIWAVGNQHVVLKGGINLPLDSIIKVVLI